MKPATKWIVAIVGLLAGNVLAMVLLATVATVGHSEVIPDYYNKGAHYDDVMAQAETNRKLGWRVEITLVHGELAAVVRDATGQPIDGAAVTVTSFPRAYAAERRQLALAPRGRGGYGATADDRPGLHDVEITVEHGGARFVQSAVVVAR